MIKSEIRRGAYYDSVVLMGLQRALAALPGVREAGVVMGTAANKELLAQSALLTPQAEAAAADDLVIAVDADSNDQAAAALAQVDTLLAQRRGDNTVDDYRPKTLAAAAQMMPAAQWVLISTPGRYAAGVAHEALGLGKHLFLYSDNVPLEDEIALKQLAAQRGLLVMGPDCGTAIINGVGLGFANRVRRGSIGVVGASGTGLQLVTARIHQFGGGITHALGAGGRDLSEAVGAITTRQALDLLARDPDTRVIVLISKPPAPSVADELVRQARASGKPTVINFIGHRPAESQLENVYFVQTLDGAAELAVALAQLEDEPAAAHPAPAPLPTGRYLRGLFSGGTLAYEAQLLLQEYLPIVYANAPLDKRFKLEKSTVSQGHTVLDLGEDEFTVGRLHPMLDNELRIKRLAQEAADPETAILLLDVVLGDGAHPDPASELAPAIAQAIAGAAAAGRTLEVVAVVVGTDADPQGLEGQIEQLRAAGAQVELSNEAAVRLVGQRLRKLNSSSTLPPVALDLLQAPFQAINVGLASFTTSLQAQGAAALQVDWRPPAGGNERLAAILARMKRQ
jgi:FdrA protein